MVVRGWGGTVATAVGVGLAVGAAQLGMGYGLDIIGWASGRTGPTAVTEAANLSWATWIAASSAILGAVIAHRLGSVPTNPVKATKPDVSSQGSTSSQSGAPTDLTDATDSAGPEAPDRVVRWLWRPVLAVAAGLGAAITVLLVMAPARSAAAVDSASVTAATYTALGVVAGVVIAVGALAARPVAANLLATTAWLWLLGIAGVIETVITGTEPVRIPLGFWETTVNAPWFRTILVPDVALPLAAALVIGALAALRAARRGDHPVGVVLSGGAGPLVLTVAYLITQPDLTSADAVDVSRHLVLPYLVLAGIFGALLASLLRPRQAVDVDADGVVAVGDPSAAVGEAAVGEAVDTEGADVDDPTSDSLTTSADTKPTAHSDSAAALAATKSSSKRKKSKSPVPSPRTSD
jgi:hypothetical protein